MLCVNDLATFPVSYPFLLRVGPFPLQEKCHQYWPAERSARYQYFVVDPMAEYNMPQYILREFKVTDARVSLPPFTVMSCPPPHLGHEAAVNAGAPCYTLHTGV